MRAVRVVAAGESLLAPTVTTRFIEGFWRQPSTVTLPPELAQLTAREREVLSFLAMGFSNGEIAERLVVGLGTVALT